MTYPKWLAWSQRIQAIAQSGLQYTQNTFDTERFRELSHIAAEIMAVQTESDAGEVLQVFSAQAGYATPKLDVRGVVFKDDKILLVRELLDGGAWTLPGGWIDINEPPSVAVERELREEAGVIVKAKKLLAVFDRNLHGHPPYPFHAYKLFFLCDLIAEATPDPIETSDPTYFAENKLPSLSLARVTLEEVKRMFVHHRQPDLPTDFD
ncbi:MAG: ADP-ribose pyrophosphatase [Anaerolinea sp.]|nr:ADP-ribose pyrophosphatase [Anaerolinea sp.]